MHVPFKASAKKHKNMLISVRYNTRELNKICSGNLYPFSPESIKEHILAPTNEADWVIRFQLSPGIFKIVYTDHLKAHSS